MTGNQGNIELRDYQLEAIESFKDKEKGVLKMATGTGKTFTALSIANEIFNNDNKQFLVIMVPTRDLIIQWVKNFKKFNIKNYLQVDGSNRRWEYELKDSIWNYNYNFTNRVIVIGTYNSMGLPRFNDILTENIDRSFLLADECHNIGLKKFKNCKLVNFQYRLGLSATPEKWRDYQGNMIIEKYFPNCILEYSLDKAIDQDMLVEYNYYPIVVKFTKDELETFENLTNLIRYYMLDKDENKQQLESLLRRRAMIVKRAANKREEFLNILKNKKVFDPSIVFCAPGEEIEITKSISNLGIKANRFTSKIDSKNREKSIELLLSREIDMLVSIKCLDEGVDIPIIKDAYILSSTSNPREYIQRRGRVLRKSDEKLFANIYDFIVLDENLQDKNFESIANIEMPRFAEFSDLARNKYEARSKVRFLLEKRNLLDLIDKKPENTFEDSEKENHILWKYKVI